MFTAKIIDIKKDVYQFSQEPFIDVEVAILNADEEVVETKKFAYKADTTEDEITADLEKMLDTYELELSQAEEQKASAELHAKADATIEALQDAEIVPAEKEESKPAPTKKGKK
jgi:hypothetical protein